MTPTLDSTRVDAANISQSHMVAPGSRERRAATGKWQAGSIIWPIEAARLSTDNKQHNFKLMQPHPSHETPSVSAIRNTLSCCKLVL